MDEELQKRNTDCVYFLASPLTCKKGIDCEYRHSEIVRLNPRDCWYWLAGSCLKPTCAFRHPPSERCTEGSSESTLPQYQCSVPVNKTNVPCYFYFNGFCNKGDQCSFLHGPEDGNDTGSAPIETHPNSCETAPKRAAEIQNKTKEELHQSAPNIGTVQIASPHISASESEETAAIRSGSLLPADSFIQSRSHLCTDQSSEEQVDGHIEREEWLESSPGFDVLVDDRSENLDYDCDPECLLALGGEGKELSNHFLGYDYDDHIEKIPGRSRERMLDPTLPHKRQFLPMELAIDGWRGVDLRYHLKKRRIIDGCPVTHFSRRHNSSQWIGQSRERSRRQRTQWLHGRFASEVENNIIGSHGENEIMLNGASKQGRFRHSRTNRFRRRFKEKKHSKHQSLPSEVSRKPASKKRRSTEESAMFTGPMTLAEIKEEKRKASENGDSSVKMERSSRITSEDFQGPKPLSEILKDKRRLGLVMDDSNDSS
ncbi:hypothetical protein F0562_009456 [Nyssa sinensis]|uniref:C3H1-type domain-containing protein n=1 Tax=Nyssa sinensis TaxID=561372 RepID=A0A5J4ZW08_9ASTE|nr:hypothetical protein F0562_009456 [Nyssa sinensis]